MLHGTARGYQTCLVLYARGSSTRRRRRRFVVVAKTSLLRSVTGLPYGGRCVRTRASTAAGRRCNIVLFAVAGRSFGRVRDGIWGPGGAGCRVQLTVAGSGLRGMKVAG